MSESTYQGIDWKLTIRQEDILVQSWDASEPDPEWSYVDKAFHGHCYVDGDGSLNRPIEAPEHYPTLRIVREGDDEDDYEVWTVCAICEETIVPGTRSVNPVSYVRGPADATLTLDVRLSGSALEEVMANLRANPQMTSAELLAGIRR